MIRGFPNGETRRVNSPSSCFLQEPNRVKQNLLVARGKETEWDSLSSGERTGNSLNRAGAMAVALARTGEWDVSGGVHRLLGELQNPQVAEAGGIPAP